MPNKHGPTTDERREYDQHLVRLRERTDVVHPPNANLDLSAPSHTRIEWHVPVGHIRLAPEFIEADNFWRRKQWSPMQACAELEVLRDDVLPRVLAKVTEWAAEREYVSNSLTSDQFFSEFRTSTQAHTFHNDAVFNHFFRQDTCIKLTQVAYETYVVDDGQHRIVVAKMFPDLFPTLPARIYEPDEPHRYVPPLAYAYNNVATPSPRVTTLASTPAQPPVTQRPPTSPSDWRRFFPRRSHK